ncbi:MAG: sterol desaturase/sphingolipid hydroxylase (fatty acid hydroxylase superfamily) [Gammaproteobacteria bacterium]|jgi:sterol desaturase/sphingolipid hydroxylase (fatty acid hydroxylase superfamily)
MSSSAILAFGFSIDREVLFFNFSYAWIIAWLLLLERCFPYKPAWRIADGQTGANLSHTLLNKGLVQLLLVQIIALGLLDNTDPSMVSQLPLTYQVAFGLIISEIGLYGAHRLAHEWPLLWRCHAVHHSVRRLWLVNTGRFHFIDSLASVAAGAVFFLLSGISMDAIVWVSAITAYIGILTHCNVDMECGLLNYVFNTPNLHRWHHSSERAEGDRNYGENLMLWDLILGTFLYKKGSHIERIGIHDKMPERFLDQLALPFRWRRYQESKSTLGEP